MILEEPSITVSLILQHDNGIFGWNPKIHDYHKVCHCHFAGFERKHLMEIESKGKDDGQFNGPVSTLENISEIFLEMTKEEIDERLIMLFNTRTFYARNLVKETESGKDYDAMIRHIKLLEYCVKVLKTCESAAKLAYHNFIADANIKEREAIAEADRKYKPKFKEREAQETQRMTEAEKKIRNLMKAFKLAGRSDDEARAMSEKIIFGA